MSVQLSFWAEEEESENLNSWLEGKLIEDSREGYRYRVLLNVATDIVVNRNPNGNITGSVFLEEHAIKRLFKKKLVHVPAKLKESSVVV